MDLEYLNLDQDKKTTVKDILVENDLSGNKFLIQQQELTLNKHNQIDLLEVLDIVKSFPIKNAMIFYYDPTMQVNIFFNPNSQNNLIHDIFGDKLILRFSPQQTKLPEQDIHENLSTKKLRQRKKPIHKLEKRVKERQIQQVIDLVSQWRRYHEGEDKLNLDIAAQKVGIARKTLDDYFLCIRRARELGFDFQNLKNEKMGYLRRFLKDNKQLSLQLSSRIGQVKVENQESGQIFQNQPLGNSTQIRPSNFIYDKSIIQNESLGTSTSFNNLKTSLMNNNITYDKNLNLDLQLRFNLAQLVHHQCQNPKFQSNFSIDQNQHEQIFGLNGFSSNISNMSNICDNNRLNVVYLKKSLIQIQYHIWNQNHFKSGFNQQDNQTLNGGEQQPNNIKIIQQPKQQLTFSGLNFSQLNIKASGQAHQPLKQGLAGQQTMDRVSLGQNSIKIDGKAEIQEEQHQQIKKKVLTVSEFLSQGGEKPQIKDINQMFSGFYGNNGNNLGNSTSLDEDSKSKQGDKL